MEICFLGQGFPNNESVEKTFIHSLDKGDFNRFTAIVAFASEGGVRSVIDRIKSAKNTLTEIEFYIGIDQQVTSYEALNLLLESKIDCYIYHPNSDDFIFHPKIYIFEGKKRGKIIIGSSNLTKRGLSLNMEASLVINFGMNDKEGVVLLNQIKDHYHFLLDKTPPNIKKLTPELLDLFVALKKVTKGKQREAKSKKSKTPQNEKLLAEFNAMFPPVKIPKNTSKPPKRKTPKTDVKKVRKVTSWQDTDPKADHYRHPDIGSTALELQTKLKDKNGKVVSNGDVVEWVASKGDLKGQTLIGVIKNLTYNSGGKTYKKDADGYRHPRYHVFADVVLPGKDGKDAVVGKQVKIERVTKHNASGALAKQTRKSHKEYAARKAMQKANSK